MALHGRDGLLCCEVLKVAARAAVRLTRVDRVVGREVGRPVEGLLLRLDHLREQRLGVRRARVELRLQAGGIDLEGLLV